MPTNTKKLTANQQKFLAWLSLPKVERHPRTQELFAEKLGVHYSTLSKWKNDAELGLETQAAELAREHVSGHLPDIYGALIREAKSGSFQHIKLALEVAEHHTDEVNVNVSDKRERVIRELSEFEQRRRAQMAG